MNRILVTGTARFNEELPQRSARMVGITLAQNGFHLVTGNATGVDRWDITVEVRDSVNGIDLVVNMTPLSRDRRRLLDRKAPTEYRSDRILQRQPDSL